MHFELTVLTKKKKVAQNTDKNTCLSEHAKLPCQTCLTNFHVFASFPRECQCNKLAIFVDSFVILRPIDISGCCCCFKLTTNTHFVYFEFVRLHVIPYTIRRRPYLSYVMLLNRAFCFHFHRDKVRWCRQVMIIKTSDLLMISLVYVE